MLIATLKPAFGEVAGRVLPSKLRRFTPMPDWATAAQSSRGYDLHSQHESPGTYKATRLNTGGDLARECQFLSALGIALADHDEDREFRVLDVGGATGHYHAVAAAAYPGQAFAWTILETATVTNLMGHAEHPADIRWCADLDEALATGPDFVLASAFLNYVEHPFAILPRFVAARHVFVTRLPLWPIPHDVVAIQKARVLRLNGSYPTWFFARESFLLRLSELGEIVLHSTVPQDAAYLEGHYLPYNAILVRTDTHR